MHVERPNCSDSEKVEFQLLDVDYYETECDTVIRIFGLTARGNSVLVKIYGFAHYFFVLRNGKQETEVHTILKERFRYDEHAIVGVSSISARSVYGFASNTGEEGFFKIRMSRPSLISSARDALKSQGFSVTYESNVDIVTRFMIDTKLVGCCWIEMITGRFTFASYPISNCQIEINARPDSIIGHMPNDERWNHISPIRVLSFDIEVAGRRGVFPEAHVDPVIQIASVVKVHGCNDYLCRSVFVVGSCAPISKDVNIFQCASESALLRQWRNFVLSADPDIITGYNIDNFDFKYLLERAEYLNITSFSELGRIRMSRARSMGVAGGYFANNHKTSISGRIVMDLFSIAKREHKLRTYSLNAVSEHFLGERKDDVHYTEIAVLHAGDENSRRKLAEYCLKDAMLPLMLMSKWMTLTNCVEMSRVSGVPMRFLVSRGQQVKVFAQILREAKAAGFVLPTFDKASTVHYTGGLVLDPYKGFHKEPIVVLDFSSLYPSIMIAYNLCYSTLITEDSVLRPYSVNKTPSGSQFATKEVRKGILPLILEKLISQRLHTKQLMSREKDKDVRRVYDGRQLALKVTANAVYGFTGAQTGLLPCVQISESVTAYGREIIERARALVECRYCKCNGFEADAEVVYGDTDSVMIKFGVNSVERAVKLGREAAAFVTSRINMPPLRLEFEKVFDPFLLMSKKRYVGLAYSSPEAVGAVESKGIETNRRDNCPLVSEVVSSCLHSLLVNKDADEAVTVCRNIITELSARRVEISKLVITKELTNKRYKVKLPHTELTKRIALRNPGTEPKLGDRVPYVVLMGKRSSAIHTRSEDPDYATQHRMQLDISYYVERQLFKPLQRILGPVIGKSKVEELLLGQRKRNVRAKSNLKQSTLEAFGFRKVQRK